MTTPEFKPIRAYVHGRMRSELDPRLTYHSIAHTFDEVLPAAERIGTMLGIDERAQFLVRTAAVFHDLGFVKSRNGHEEASVAIARQVLPTYGCTTEQIDVIAGMIMATRLPQTPQMKLEEILVDADSDVLGSHHFLERNQDLRNELSAFGTIVSDLEWYTGQLDYLRSHRYFTVVREIRDERKQQNIALLEARLRQAELQTDG